MNLVDISEIEKIKSISSPHAEELKKFGEKWVDLSRELDNEDLETVSSSIRGKLEDLGLDEEWTLTKEFFPEVKVHVSYHYHGEEFSEYGESDNLRFLFSGSRVRKLTGEDLTGMIDVMLNFVGGLLSGKVRNGGERHKYLPERYYESRADALNFLELDDGEIESLVNFLGCQSGPERSEKVLKKQFFSDVFFSMTVSDDSLRGFCLEDKAGRLNDYERDLLSICTLNHIVRFVALKYSDRDLPEICRKVFP